MLKEEINKFESDKFFPELRSKGVTISHVLIYISESSDYIALAFNN